MDKKSDKAHEKLLSLENDIAKLSNELQEKTRALEIESALEVVRGRTMAMQHSDELKDVIQVVHDQLVKLGIYTEHAGFILNYKENEEMHIWLADKNTIASEIRIPYFDSPHWNSFQDAKANGKSFFSNLLSLKEKNKFYKDLFSLVPELPEDLLETYLAYPALAISTVLLDNIGLYIENFEGIPYSQEENITLMRFGKVFQQTYTRFLDLQKAEAQAREAEIELALERVRARSMAMYRSEELVVVATVLHNELKSLNVREFSETSIVVHDEPNQELIVWGAQTGSGSLEKVVFPLLGDQILQKLYDTWRKKEDFFTLKVEGAALRKHIDFVFPKASRSALEDEAIKSMPDPTFFHCAFFCMGYLELMADKELSQDSASLLVRFARVFDQSYTRFLDLQKAEAQAREAQIEASLERVRSRSLAMRGTEEFLEVAAVVYEELKKLEITSFESCGVNIYDEEKEIQEIYNFHIDLKQLTEFKVPMKGDKILDERYAAWKRKDTIFHQTAGGKALNDHLKYAHQGMELGASSSWIEKFGFPDPLHFHFGNFAHGYLHVISSEELAKEHKSILGRFATVFEQVYVRFLDLQKAEAQAREAQIEAGLERVRSRTMGMKKSEELLEVAGVLYKELKALGVSQFTTCGYVEVDEKNHKQHGWLTNSDGTSLESFSLPLSGDPVFDERYDAWKQKERVFHQVVAADKLKKHLEFAMTEFGSIEVEEMVRTQFPDPTIFYCSNFSHGYLHIITAFLLNEEEESLMARFTKVFEQTYTRFLDLQKAESQAREAKIELSLERVRSRAMAMHKSEELSNVVALLYKEIGSLDMSAYGFELILFKSENNILEYWSTPPNQEFSKCYKIPRTMHPFFEKQWTAWENQEARLVIILEGKDKDDFNSILFNKTEYRDLPEKIKQEINDQQISTFSHAYMKYGFLEAIDARPLSTGDFLILGRFAKVFEQTYTRFLDLQKAEAQTREAEIELALERVRAKTMAMQKSEELRELVFEYYKQIHPFGFAKWGFEIKIAKEDKSGFYCWISPPGARVQPEGFNIPTLDHWVLKKYWSAYERQIPILSIVNSGDDKRRLAVLLLERSDMKNLPEDVKTNIMETEYVHFTVAAMRFGLLKAVDMEPVVEKDSSILQRFAKVFEQTYTRFLDLKKAEAQAREAQIEVALERVRSRMMAMHKTEELHEALATVFTQLQVLGFEVLGGSLIIYDQELAAEHWMIGFSGSEFPESYKIPYNDHTYYTDLLQAWQNGVPFQEFIFEGELKVEYGYWALENSDFKRMPQEFKKEMVKPDRLVISDAFNKYGMIEILGPEPLPEESIIVLKRFSNVFEQTYTRFLDLQKAEKQAREAQIEAALERVRSKAMAMHSSEDLSFTVDTFFAELKLLNVQPRRCGVGIIDHDSRVVELSATATAVDSGIKIVTASLTLSGHPVLNDIFENWLSQKEYLPVLRGKEIQEYYKAMNPEVSYPDIEENETEYGYYFFFKEGGVFAWTNEELSSQDIEIFRRYNSVLSLTYRRYIDLVEAEQQAREARIEAALERVRSKAMAMRNSEDIGEATTILFKEIEKLEIKTMRCGILIIHDNKVMDVWTTSTTKNDKIVSISGQINMTIHPLLEGIFNGWKSGASQSQYELVGKDGEKYYKAIGQELSYNLPTSSATKDRHFNTSFNFNEGALFTFTKNEISESARKIYERFAKVFGLTYQRYRELIESEKREKEANKQSSLDRVRGEIASMRSTEDLNKITPIIWQELTNLGVPFFRCGVFIMNEEKENIQVYLSDPNGKSLGLMNLEFTTSDLTKNSAEAWRNNEVFKSHWSKEEFVNWANSLKDLGKIETKEGYQGGDDAPESLDLHFVPFAQGMLYVGNLEPLEEEQIELVKNLAESFSIAYSRYEDFNKLEKAKEKVEEALTDLKSTQAQLIQSEKMASLGELTAGIAHEIQNPLNFVNNFSEVSNELIDEMNEEIEKGDFAEAKAISNDIKQNLEKINHHGKRADAIVKGMLQHSRKSSAEKELTDINKLADEYLRLAYHGLRAKDKTFNATLETNFDESIGLVDIIPQDMGRVILNLITNAFYACNSKKKATDDDTYKPTVSIATLAEDDNVKIRVKDNGNGIPKDALDKIFQPFFTTKPTGEGTGLGLSLSYDIVKAHGGELKVESHEGDGTSFIIHLPI